MPLLRESLFLLCASTAVLATAHVMILLLRRSSAALRNRVLASAFLIVLLLPAIAGLLPAPVEHAAATTARQGQATLSDMQPVTIADTEAGAAPAMQTSSPPPAIRVPWLLTILGLWLAGAAAFLLRLANSHWQARGLLRKAEPVSNTQLIDLGTRLRRQLGTKRQILLFQSRDLPGPVTVGLLRPIIILPWEARTWSPAEAEAILHHELAHAVRRDNAVNLIASLVAALHWFNPLVWLALTRLRRETELACDDAVLRGGLRPSVYARVLLDHARMPARRIRRFAFEPATPFACHARHRLTLLLDPKVDRSRAGRLATATFSLLLLAATLPLTPLRPPVTVGAADALGGESSRLAASALISLVPAGLKNDIETGFDEIAAEIREARALNAWRKNPALGTALPDGRIEIPAREMTVEVRDALALPGSKYGCIFTSENGYVRAKWRDGDSTIHLTLKAVRHPEASDFDLWLDSMADLIGAGQDGEFRAYSISRRHDGIRTSFEDKTRLEMQAVIAALVQHVSQPAQPDDDPEDES